MLDSASMAIASVAFTTLATAGLASATAIGGHPTVRFVRCGSQASGGPRNPECGSAHLPQSTGFYSQPVSNRASGPDLNRNPAFK